MLKLPSDDPPQEEPCAYAGRVEEPSTEVGKYSVGPYTGSNRGSFFIGSAPPCHEILNSKCVHALKKGSPVSLCTSGLCDEGFSQRVVTLNQIVVALIQPSEDEIEQNEKRFPSARIVDRVR